MRRSKAYVDEKDIVDSLEKRAKKAPQDRMLRLQFNCAIQPDKDRSENVHTRNSH